jgi:hypothetical protein
VLNGTVEMGANGGKAPVMINSGQWASIDAAGALSPAQPTSPEILKAVLDATSDTATNTVPAPSTSPSLPVIPLPQITPAPTQPKPPTRANKNSQGGNKTGGGGGYGGGMTGN